MLEAYIRPGYQKLFVDPFVKHLAGFRFITPNSVTVLGAVLGVFASVLILVSPLWACILLLLSGYCDTLDGTLARYLKVSSAKGTVLDIVCDRVVEISVLLGLFAVSPEHRAWLSLFMLAAIFLCVTTFLVVGIFIENEHESGKSFHYSKGLIERPEAFVFFILMILLPSIFYWLASLFILLVFYTAFKRLIDFMRAKKSPVLVQGQG